MHYHTLTRLGRTARLASTAIFLCALGLPIAAGLLLPKAGRGPGEAAERLPALSASAGSLAAFADALRGGYVERNFPLRSTLIRLDNFVSIKVLYSSFFTAVAEGRDGWLFLAKDKGRDLLEDQRAVAKLPPAAAATVAADFEARRQWLAERGIRYLLVVVPDKATIYPEDFPPGFDLGPRRSYLDQTLDALRHGTRVDVLDLRPALLEAKKAHQVFYRTDTHWNAYGAYAAYLATVDRLETYFPGFKARTLTDYRVETKMASGDQAKVLGLEDAMSEEFTQFFPSQTPKSRFVYDYRADERYSAPAWASTQPGAGLPSAVILHDSFFVEQSWYFADHFRHVVYVWPQAPDPGERRFFDTNLIEAEHPDIVIEEFAERYFRALPPQQGH